jgi:hypothetical protein
MVSVADVSARLREMQEAAPLATRTAVVAMGLLMTAETKLTLTRSGSHTAGTPTPSPAGSPPAKISGDLRDSVMPMPPEGEGPIWSTIVGGTTVYARIQELGGDIYPKNSGGWLANKATGQVFVTPYSAKDHVELPPRPYLKPTAEELIGSGKLTSAACRGWLVVMNRL